MNAKKARTVTGLVAAFGLLILLFSLRSPVSSPEAGLVTDSTNEWTSIQELVANKDAIVIGDPTGVYTETIITDPTPPGGWPTGVPTMPPDVVAKLLQYQASEHEIVSYQPLHHNGGLYMGKHFLVRMIGHPSDYSSTEISDRYPDSEGQYLFFLAQEQPGLYGVVAGGMLHVDGQTVTWPDGSAFDLAAGMSTSEFMEAVQDEIEEQY